MGIKDLLPRINPILSRTRLSTFPGSTVSIDLSMLIHQASHGQADRLLNANRNSNFGRLVDYKMTDGERVKEQEDRVNKFVDDVATYVIDRCLGIIQENVNLICVLDGKSPPLKRAVAAKRREENEVAFAGVDEHSTSTTTTTTSSSSSSSASTFESTFESTSEATSINYKNIRKAGGSTETRVKIHESILQKLRTNKIKFIVAPYEADSQLAYLSTTCKIDPVTKKISRKKLTDIVITDDSDAIPYACPKVLFKFDSNFFGDYYQRADLGSINTKNLSLLSFTPSMVACFCITSGCDYLPNLCNVGPITANSIVRDAFASFISGDSSSPSPLETLFKKLQPFMKGYTPKGILKYERDFLRALILFRHPTVYNPITKQTVIMNLSNPDVELTLYKPYKRMAKDSSVIEEFCGSLLPDGVSSAVCEGFVNPSTFELYDVDSTPDDVVTVLGVWVESGGKEKLDEKRKAGRDFQDQEVKDVQDEMEELNKEQEEEQEEEEELEREEEEKSKKKKKITAGANDVPPPKKKVKKAAKIDKEAVKINAKTLKYKNKFIALYTKHAPDKLSKINGVIEKYKDCLGDAYLAATAKYGESVEEEEEEEDDDEVEEVVEKVEVQVKSKAQENGDSDGVKAFDDLKRMNKIRVRDQEIMMILRKKDKEKEKEKENKKVKDNSIQPEPPIVLAPRKATTFIQPDVLQKQVVYSSTADVGKVRGWTSRGSGHIKAQRKRSLNNADDSDFDDYSD